MAQIFLSVLFFQIFSFALFSDSGNGIGVFPFVNSSETDGEKVASIIVTELGAKGRYKLIEKSQLSKILAEIKLSQSGLVDEATATQTGLLVGANYMIVGEINKSDYNYNITARLIKTSTGIVIGSSSAKEKSLDISAKQVASYLDEFLNVYFALDNPDSPFIVKLKLDKGKNPSYHPGEKVKLSFLVESKEESLRDCFVTVYSVNSEGLMTRLFPNKYTRDRVILLGKEYTFPAEEDDFEWEITGKSGFEFIQVVARKKDSDLFSNKRSLDSDAFQKLGKESEAIRGVLIKIKKEKLKDYSAERISFKIQE